MGETAMGDDMAGEWIPAGYPDMGSPPRTKSMALRPLDMGTIGMDMDVGWHNAEWNDPPAVATRNVYLSLWTKCPVYQYHGSGWGITPSRNQSMDHHDAYPDV